MIGILNIIHNKFLRLRLQPIRVFCFHHVSDGYEPLTMWKCDWTQIDQFKRNVLQMKEGEEEFISIQEAHHHLQNDIFRRKKYAVLTADDGYKSILNILPWLEEQHIPVTLFVNTKYLDGKSWSEINEEQARRVNPDVDMLKDVCPSLYLSMDELEEIAISPYVTIGMHGHEHLDATKQTIEDFRKNVEQCKDVLQNIPHVIPYFAYAWGKHNAETDKVLKEMSLIPVLVDGTKNYNNSECVDRIAIDGKSL